MPLTQLTLAEIPIKQDLQQPSTAVQVVQRQERGDETEMRFPSSSSMSRQVFLHVPKTPLLHHLQEDLAHMGAGKLEHCTTWKLGLQKESAIPGVRQHTWNPVCLRPQDWVE